MKPKREVETWVRRIYRFVKNRSYTITIKPVIPGYYALTTHESQPLIDIDNKVKLHELPAVLIHEILHCTAPEMSEKNVMRLERAIMRLLSVSRINRLILTILRNAKKIVWLTVNRRVK